jgi:hypothetical protein
MLYRFDPGLAQYMDIEIIVFQVDGEVPANIETTELGDTGHHGGATSTDPVNDESFFGIAEGILLEKAYGGFFYPRRVFLS